MKHPFPQSASPFCPNQKKFGTEVIFLPSWSKGNQFFHLLEWFFLPMINNQLLSPQAPCLGFTRFFQIQVLTASSDTVLGIFQRSNSSLSPLFRYTYFSWKNSFHGMNENRLHEQLASEINDRHLKVYILCQWHISHCWGFCPKRVPPLLSRITFYNTFEPFFDPILL